MLSKKNTFKYNEIFFLFGTNEGIKYVLRVAIIINVRALNFVSM